MARGALTLDPAAFQAIRNDARANLLIIALLLLAGASYMLGQSVVLLANKVRPTRFVSSLALAGGFLVVQWLIWTTIFILIGKFLTGVVPIFGDMGRAVGLAYAPFLLGFLVLIPYMGSFLEHTLAIWSLLAMVVALAVTLHLGFWEALACALSGWIIIQALQYTIGRPVMALRLWMMQLIAGTKFGTSVEEVINASTGDAIEDEGKER